MSTRTRHGRAGAFCRRCGRGRRHQRTVFSQGSFWMWLIAVLAVVWLWSAARGQS